MTDRYTQAVLTVIALALTVLAYGQLRPHDATAQSFGSGCGERSRLPCYVEIVTEQCGGILNPCYVDYYSNGIVKRGLPVEVVP